MTLEARLKRWRETYHAGLRPDGLRAAAEGAKIPFALTSEVAAEFFLAAADRIEELEQQLAKYEH